MSQAAGSPGINADKLAMVREALKLLQKTQTGFPIGSDIWSALDQSIAKLAKVAPESAENAGVQQEALRGLQRGAQADQQMDAVMRSLGGAGAGGGAGAAAAAPSPATPAAA